METIRFDPSGRFFVMAGRLFNGNWNAAFYGSADKQELHTLKTGYRVTSSAFSESGDVLFLGGGKGQPRNREAEGDFGVVKAYSIG